MQMNKPLITGLMISAVFVTAGAAVAGLGIADRGPRYADVLGVEPVQTTRVVTRRECTPARAASRTSKCRTVHETKRELVGYDVRYRLGRDEGIVRLDRPPGDRLRFQDGVASIDAS
jgi:uncharacterized protein YcfJ